MINYFNKIKQNIKEKFNFLNMFIAILISYTGCFAIYNIIEPHLGYFNLDDFYFCETVFQNHNKYLDTGIFYIYIILFFILFYFLKCKTIKLSDFNLKKYQKILSVVFIFTTLFFIFQYFLNYSLMPVLDQFHYGEKFGAYYLHAKQGLKYYSDIVLMHGYIDVLSSQIADKFLGGLTFYNERLAFNIISITYAAVSFILACFLFRKQYVNIIMMSGLLIFLLKINTDPWICYTYLNFLVLMYILLLEKYNKFNNYVWNIIFYAVFLYAAIYHSTYSLAFSIGMLPLLVKRIKDFPKFCIIFYSIAFIITLCFLGDYLIPYFHSMTYYSKSALIVFANKFHNINLFLFTIGCSALILCPVFINLAIITKSFRIRYISLLTIIVTILLLPYAFGKIDGTELVRFRPLSIITVSVMLPYILIKMKSKFVIFYNILVLLIFVNIPIWWSDCPNNSFDKTKSVFIKNNFSKSKFLLNLTSDNMIYYLANVKPAMPYSYQNIINTQQQKDILKNLPLKSSFYVLMNADIDISERLNTIYHWLFSQKNYKIINENNNIYIYFDNTEQENKNNLKDFDKYMSQANLEYLPDAWGASIKTLPMYMVNKKIKVQGSVIVFEEPVLSQEADLLYIEYTANGETDFSIQTDSSDSKLYFKSKRNKILIPIDYYPSWYLSDKINSVTLETNQNIKILKAQLYKRK